jgi:hypothetical protein
MAKADFDNIQESLITFSINDNQNIPKERIKGKWWLRYDRNQDKIFITITNTNNSKFEILDEKEVNYKSGPPDYAKFDGITIADQFRLKLWIYRGEPISPLNRVPFHGNFELTGIGTRSTDTGTWGGSSNDL